MRLVANLSAEDNSVMDLDICIADEGVLEGGRAAMDMARYETALGELWADLTGEFNSCLTGL
jgi:glycine cleavage system aminomethyltransferase T